jgi:predicted carbohydrate-binding protein with CBM5 and CBM33 domain
MKIKQSSLIHRALPLFVLLGLATSSNAVFAHGYLNKPEARGRLCQTAANSQCGAVQYEPQSLEGPKGFPAQGPADGGIASASLAQFSAMDEQTASRWAKTSISAGQQTFSWTLTARHSSMSFRYFITRQDWDPNQRLTRASFEPQPFCEHSGNSQVPASFVVSHTCNVPQRSGYQLILAIWDIADTVNAFYNVADVTFAVNQPPASGPTWDSKGRINPSADLASGDQVMTRVFDSAGERPDLQTRLRIGTSADGLRDTWPYLLAQRINAEQTLLRAGRKNSDGTISAVPGVNDIFVRSDSRLERVETQIEKATEVPFQPDLLLQGVPSSANITNGQLTLSFPVTAVGEMDVSATLLDANGQIKGMTQTTLNNSSKTLTLSLANLRPGRHSLVVKGVVKGSGALIQKTSDILLNSIDAPSTGIDFRFPEGLSHYKAGTRVLQPKNGKVYECRPWPYNGYCVQWSIHATQFEPGIGTHWREAWIER